MMYIISGCNGAGKTTFASSLLLDFFQCKEFVNADKIAEGLSPFNPESAALSAGKIMIDRLENLSRQQVDFGIETTLSGKVYEKIIHKNREKGYTIWLIYLWLSTPDLAKKRVALRVQKGGHNITNEVTDRRYLRGVKNLFQLYMPLCDRWFIFDNSGISPLPVCEGTYAKTANIFQPDIWAQINHFKETIIETI